MYDDPGCASVGADIRSAACHACSAFGEGIRRLAGRLREEQADELVGSVLEVFHPPESCEAWHGGCLAVAELCRKGRLPQERLNAIIPIIFQALGYDGPGYA
ncbi:Tubulin-specific chaperone D [Zootermopsis nevadensis]|uniref:Tubulin-specific chaperone D n=1 Tax=Zootermopsis nevadensis TaxID=136037 RepID=A0A067QPG9_ZOONE|nr:Tubulin-specific chaperone D [Zootermopsis nevadensis]